MQIHKKVVDKLCKCVYNENEVIQMHKYLKKEVAVMYLNLKTEMARNNTSIEEVANCLGIHRNSASNKINGGSFSIEEGLVLQKELFPYADLQYLFRKINKQAG